VPVYGFLGDPDLRSGDDLSDSNWKLYRVSDRQLIFIGSMHAAMNRIVAETPLAPPV
jgi:hypothetical protein